MILRTNLHLQRQLQTNKSSQLDTSSKFSPKKGGKKTKQMKTESTAPKRFVLKEAVKVYKNVAKFKQRDRKTEQTTFLIKITRKKNDFSCPSVVSELRKESFGSHI